MKFPDDVRKQLSRRFKSKHREWLEAVGADVPGEWPLQIDLGIPTESQASRQIEAVRDWVVAWQSWQGTGKLIWADRRWRTLGTQQVPERLLLAGPAEIAQWVGEMDRWEGAQRRYGELTAQWPKLGSGLARYFDVLADYEETDFRRLVDLLAWIATHPDSDLYPRQLPVAGLDTKWLDGRKRLLSDLIGTMRGGLPGGGEFYRLCGLKAPPPLIRLRFLDPSLRARTGGLGDVTAPVEELAGLDIPVDNIFIVENLQTGLAFEDLPDSIVIMQLGYGVDLLGRLPWLARARCFYWGDLDTHGFAILSRARQHIQKLQSLLMDEETLFRHRDLWVQESNPHGAEALPLLSASEQAVYRAIKQHDWGQNIRLEQERVAWDIAWQTLLRTV